MDTISYSVAAKALKGLLDKANVSGNSIVIPSGTTAERPSLGASDRTLRFNTDNGILEQWTGTLWKDFSVSALELKGTDTEANILLKSGTSGDLWIASDTLDGFMYDNGSWTNIGPLQGPQGDQGIQGIQGETGNGIASITRTSGDGTAGSTDIYTITYTDATTDTLTVYNGIDGVNGIGVSSITRTSGTGAAGTTDTYTITYSDASTSTFNVYNGADGISVNSISKTDTTGLVDTYTISYSDASTSTFTIVNGNGVSGITKTNTVGLVDTYTITFDDGTTTTYNITNGSGIDNVSFTSTTDASGLAAQEGATDTYTITYTDGTSSTYDVVNGTDGLDGALSTIDKVEETVTADAADYTVTIDTTNGLFSVFLNGYKLDEGSYTLTGTSVVVNTDVFVDDIVTVEKLEVFELVDTYTQAETDALVGGVINDTTPSTTTTYSSNKIDTELAAIDMTGIISDTVTATDSTWSSDKINTELTDAIDDASQIETPSITTPTDGAIDFSGEIIASAFNTKEKFFGSHNQTEWQISTVDTFTTLADSYSGTSNLTTWTPSISAPLETYYVRVRYGSDNHWSNWSDTVSFTSPNIYIETPTVSVTDSPTEVTETPVISTSAFSVFNGTDTHVSTDWAIELTDGTPVWESIGDTSNLESILVPEGFLLESTEYVFKARFNGTTYGSSAYGSVNATTTSSFFDPLTDDPVPIGDPYEGGFYAGKMQQDDGIYALIVAPKASGELASEQFRTSNAASTGTDSMYDGWANTTAQNNSTHPAFLWSRGLTIGGFSDWYVPAIYELDLMYRNLKPTTESNFVGSQSSYGDSCSGECYGYNSKSIPAGTCRTTGDPAQTTATGFQSGGTEAFDTAYYWPSTQYCANTDLGWALRFSDGHVNNFNKNGAEPVRAVRRLKLS